jgi:hypothetical protein
VISAVDGSGLPEAEQDELLRQAIAADDLPPGAAEILRKAGRPG